jgi:hypothetical protein
LVVLADMQSCTESTYGKDPAEYAQFAKILKICEDNQPMLEMPLLTQDNEGAHHNYGFIGG